MLVCDITTHVTFTCTIAVVLVTFLWTRVLRMDRVNLLVRGSVMFRSEGLSTNLHDDGLLKVIHGVGLPLQELLKL